MADEPNPNDANLETLRTKAAAADAAVASEREARKELLFMRAGIDTTTPVGKLVFQSWQSDDLEELKTYAREVGALSAPGTTVLPEDQHLQNVRDALAGGDGGAPATTPGADEHPTHKALREFHEARQEGTRLDEAQLAVIDKIIVAGSNGDKRVLTDRRVPVGR